MVATPIGNLADISLRALDILKRVNVIAAEDTRHTRKLLAHYDISTSMVSFHEHNEFERADSLVQRVQDGQAVALVSDAGTPLISDPGHVLMRVAHDAGVKVVPVPGASAAIAALSVSGIACGKFVFEGFLPAKEGAKRAVLETYVRESKATIFYESPHRILSTLRLMAELYGDREVTLARELTKQFETIRRGRLTEMVQWVDSDANQQKGEFVLILSGCEELPSDRNELELRELLERLLKDLPPKKAAAAMSDVFGGGKKKYYEWAVEMKS